MAKSKNVRIIALAAIALIILGPLTGVLFETKKVGKNGSQTIQETSQTKFADCYVSEITLKSNQKLTIKFSVYSADTSATLLIIGKGEYDANKGDNTPQDPNTTGGRQMMVSTANWAAAPSGSTVTSVTANEDDFFFLEFMGDGNAFGQIWSEPGDYVIIVYGVNNDAAATDVDFNIEVTTDGIGSTMNSILSILGWLGLLAAIVLYFLTKKGVVAL